MDYQWYPGHMTKAKRMMDENIKLIDLVIELIDARIPYSSRNPDIDTLARNKSRIILLNKSDLADENSNQIWLDYYKEKGIYCLKINAKNGYGIKQLPALINEACREKLERNKAKGIINRPIRAMIVGIPNVGKSTFINAFAGKSCTKTGNKPGVTKGKQWIHINKGLELLDTPGILWPKFDDKEVGLHLAMIGSMNDQIINIEELSFEILKFIKTNYKNCISERYDVDESLEITEIMELIGKKRGCLGKGGTIDYEKLAGIVTDDFRSGRLGRFTVELP